MAERANTSLTLPGHFAGPNQIPGQAKWMQQRAQQGIGELQAEAHAVARVFRTRASDEYTAPLPRRVTSLAEITDGLGLPKDVAERVQKMVGQTRADFSKKGQTQRSFIATNGVLESLRRMSDVPSDARLEIMKRARAFWRNTQVIDYAKEPTVRAPQRSQMRQDTATKSERFVIRRDLFKAKFASPPPPKSGAQPKQAVVSTTKAPAGFAPIPNSKKGGFRKKGPEGWIYWYPGAGITSTPHPADRGQARARRAKEAAGSGLKKPGKGSQEPAGAAEGGGEGEGPPEAAGVPQKGAQPPPLPGKGPAGGAPGVASHKPQVERGEHGETRTFHPQVQAHVPKGKEDDHEYHANEHKRHKAMARQAMRQGDEERAKAHTYAANFHADKHNRIVAEAQGREYKPRVQYPGAEDPNEAIADSYERVPGTPMDEAGNQVSAAKPREHVMPMSENVRTMREHLGRAMHIMADMSAANDHLEQLNLKLKEAKRMGGPQGRRLAAQIKAEIALTEYDVVQLEQAHDHAMKQIAQIQKQMRMEKIRSNPVFQAFMAAMAQLQKLSASIGAKLGKKADEALEGEKGAKLASEYGGDVEIDPDVDVEMIEDDEGEEGEGSIAAFDQLREGGEDKAEAALKDIFNMQAQQAKDREESKKFDTDLATARAKRTAVEKRAAAQADDFEAKAKKRNRTRGYEETEKRTQASGVRRKAAVQKSAMLVKSAEWKRVMTLGIKLNDTLRKSMPEPIFVVPAKGAVVVRPPLTLFDLYG